LTPFWTVVPFIVYLLLIAVLPLFWARFSDSNLCKLSVGMVAGAPVVAYLLGAHPDGAALLGDAAREYAAFIALLGALFAISGGIYLRGSLAGTPAVNTALLALGALLASAIGTMGASALLIRPLLRANQRRARRRHLVVFFIFIVSNGGGLLTPLGDPPLFLGFLRGVPFAWPLRLAAPWAMVNGALLVVFALLDRALARADAARSDTAPLPRPDDRAAEAGPSPRTERGEPLRIEGVLNFVWLLGVVATVCMLGTGARRWLPSELARSAAQVAAMAGFAALSLATTPHHIRELNRFTWAPLHEIAVVFAGIFVTMVPALSFLHEHGASLGIARPSQFFWAAGALSSVLDNAPTYLTFASLAAGVAGPGQLSANDLGALAAHPTGQHLLAAVSCGSVMMGAITYIGNGPNFMVKAIAEQHHVRMPSFFGYMAWSIAILVPLFAVVALVFF
jgi:Na+/H+ antiporter NhaD/arsenite permease-like protein